MEFETVAYSSNDTVVTITMDRPEALNALSLQMAIDLRAAFRKAAEDKARAIVFTGNGRAFCAGGDLREMQAMWQKEGRVEAFVEEPLGVLHEVIGLMRELPIPIVAAVNGVCAGAGVNFALACDVVFAANDAAFRQAFVRIGLAPDCGGTFFLPRAIGDKLAAELLMTGDSIDAARALEIGMINRVVSAADLISEAGKFAAKLAAGPTSALARIKRMLNASSSNDLNSQLSLEHECQIETAKESDFKEGVAAFSEKRTPAFSGR